MMWRMRCRRWPVLGCALLVLGLVFVTIPVSASDGDGDKSSWRVGECPPWEQPPMVLPPVVYERLVASAQFGSVLVLKKSFLPGVVQSARSVALMGHKAQR